MSLSYFQVYVSGLGLRTVCAFFYVDRSVTAFASDGCRSWTDPVIIYISNLISSLRISGLFKLLKKATRDLS